MAKLKAFGANLNARDVDQKAAAHWAVHADSLDCLQALFNDETLKARDRLGRSCLHYAAERDAYKCAKAIISRKTDSIVGVDHSQRTPLHYAAVCGSARTMRVLLKAGADTDLCDIDSKTPMDYAVERQHGACVALLKSYGPGGKLSVEQQNENAAAGPFLYALFFIQATSNGNYGRI